MTVITINSNALDSKAPTLYIFSLVQETVEDSDYILIQINNSLIKDIKKELADK